MFSDRPLKVFGNLILLALIFSVTWITPAYAATNTITLDSEGDVGAASSLVLSSNGFPVISYYDQTNGDLKLAICSDVTCTIKSISIVDSIGDVGSFSSLALNSTGFPVISYWDATNLDLKLAVCSDVTCTTPTITVVDSAGWEGMHTSLALNGDGYPVISYLENDNGGNLKVAVCTDTICTSPTITTVDSEGSVGTYTSLVLNSNGYPVISYFDDTNLDLKVAVCSDAICASKTLTTVDSTGDVGRFNSLALNSSGYPVISYTDNTNYDLKLAVCSDITCTSNILTTVVSQGLIGYFTSLALNSNDFPVIVFQEFMFGDLYIAICSDTACSNKTLGAVDTDGDTGRSTSLELNGNEEPVISYYDYTNHDLKLASITSPQVVNIIRKDKNPTNISSINFTITFSEAVTGVDVDDFVLTTNGLAGASITSVSSGAGSTYTVTVNTGSGEGTIRLDLVDNDSILKNGGINLNLGGIGAGNGDFTSGEFYVIDRTRPTVSSIIRASANPTNATIVNFTVKFSEDIGFLNGFALTTTGVTGASIINVSGSGGTYTVSVNTGTGNGIIRLDVRAYLEDLAGNSLGITYSGEETYTIDKTSPDTQIDSQTNNPDNDSTPTITFSGNDSIGSGIASFMCRMDGQTYAPCTSPFTSLILADGSHTFDVYAIDISGNADASPASYSWVLDATAPNTTIMTKPASYDKDNTPTFTFDGNDSTGSGIASLNCKMDGSIYTFCTSPLTSSALVDGLHTFDVYSIDMSGNTDGSPASYSWILDTTNPKISMITRTNANPTAATSVDFSITFSELVTGVNTTAPFSDFALKTSSGISGASITGVSGSGATYTVTVNTGSGSGTIRLDVPSSATITDLAGNPLSGLPFTTGESYTLKGYSDVSRWTSALDLSHGWTVTDFVRTVGDVNGDGRADLVGFGLDGVYVALSNGTGFDPVASKWTSSFDLSHGWTVKDFVRTVGDVNGDGKADLIGFGLDGVYVALSNGTSFEPVASKWTSSFDLSHGWTVKDFVRTVGDVNGDGKADLVGFGLDGVYVALSNGTSFEPVASKWTSSFDLSHGWTVKDFVRTVGDVNGDGKADLVGFGLDGVYVALSNGTSFEPVASKWTSALDQSHGWTVKDFVRTVGDVNGDGKADLVGFGLDGVYVALSNGTSFEPAASRWTTDFDLSHGWTVAGFVRTVGDVNEVGAGGKADLIGFGLDGVYIATATAR